MHLPLAFWNFKQWKFRPHATVISKIFETPKLHTFRQTISMRKHRLIKIRIMSLSIVFAPFCNFWRMFYVLHFLKNRKRKNYSFWSTFIFVLLWLRVWSQTTDSPGQNVRSGCYQKYKFYPASVVTCARFTKIFLMVLSAIFLSLTMDLVVNTMKYLPRHFNPPLWVNRNCMVFLRTDKV